MTCLLPGPLAPDEIARRPLQDGDRILFDGKPGIIDGPGGYEPEHGWCWDIKLDDGTTTWARSGSHRLERLPADGGAS